MEGKLIKMVEGYTLSVTGNIDDLYGISNHQLAEEHQLQKLSLKNCEAIANGYDLDELAGEYANKELNVELTSKAGNFYGFSSSFKEGFQKALEILGDKKFSETELYRAFLINSAGNNTTLENTFKEIVLPMFQQTEWDVEIEMEPYHDGDFVNDGKTHVFEAKLRPQLDSEGCIILKRK